MRMIALAAVVGVGLAVGSVAFAGPWSDTEGGRLSFNSPFSNVDPPSRTANQTMVLTFDGSHDCYVIGKVNTVTARSSVDAVIRTTASPISADAWVQTANSIRGFFPSGSGATLVNQTVDTSGFWPTQRAEFSGSAEGTVYAAMQSRPGFDVMAFCRALEGSSAAPFEQLFASLGHPNDAQWRAQHEAWVAERAARAAPATPPTPTPEQPGGGN